MIQRLRSFVDNSFKPWQWWVLGALSFVVFRKTMAWLEGLYSETNFPVSVMEGQTSFSGESVKSWYAVMIEHGTLDKYVHVQTVDYLFMLTMLATLFILSMAAYRSLPSNTRIKNFAWWVGLTVSLAPFFDALENLTSFIMLANPADFPNFLANIQSSFAVCKFFLSFGGIAWAALAGAIAISMLLWRKFSE